MTAIAQTLVITRDNRRQLFDLLQSARLPGGTSDGWTDLRGELERARMVESAVVPPDVITMHSKVRLRDLDTGEAEILTLVYPAEADVSQGCISVLAPVGTALLGYREGDTIEWRVPSRLRRLKVEAVLHQPERSGGRE